MNLIFLSFMAGVAAVSFSVFFNGERKTFPAVFSGGFTAWFVFSLMLSFKYSEASSSFMASLIVGLTAETLSRVMKRPVTVFLIPSIIPLVPAVRRRRVIHHKKSY